MYLVFQLEYKNEVVILLGVIGLVSTCTFPSGLTLCATDNNCQKVGFVENLK